MFLKKVLFYGKSWPHDYYPFSMFSFVPTGVQCMVVVDTMNRLGKDQGL